MEGTDVDDAASREMEHRWGVRLPCRAAAQIRCGDGAVAAGRIRNVSTSGAFIETSIAPSRFVAVEIRVRQEDGGFGRIITACVVRHEPDGIAVEWTDTPSGRVCPLLECTERCATNCKSDH